ncbi:MAG: hypothetical protein IJD06_11390, partial [Clostridia bacterium]|nr:hypothetical protein [Clostridia bacterium]
MKRFISVLLAVLTVLTLAGCSSPSSGEISETTEAVTEAVIPDIPMEYRSVTSVGGGNTLLYMNNLELNNTADPCIVPVKEGDRM